MDLVRQLTSDTGIDAATVERGLGSIFLTIRLAVNAEQFALVKTAFPRAEEWLKKGADISGGRTGEMLAIMDAEALVDRLRAAGITEAHQQAFTTAVVGALRESLSPTLVEQIGRRVPLLTS